MADRTGTGTQAPRPQQNQVMTPSYQAVARRQEPPRPRVHPQVPEYRSYLLPDGRVVRMPVITNTQPKAGANGSKGRPPRTVPWTRKRVAKHVAVTIVILVLLSATWPMVQGPLEGVIEIITEGEPGFQFFPETAEFILVRQSTLLARSNSLSYEIDISKPFDIEGIHELRGIETAPAPVLEYTYKGQDWMKWEGDLLSGERAVIRITYRMTLHSTSWDVDTGDSGSVGDVPPEYAPYLGTEWKITPDDPQVKALAEDIVGSETNVYGILKRIYLWMDENIRYNTVRSGEPKACSVTLDDGFGDCDDQAILFASLARSVGVPVWLNLGIIYDPVRDYWGGHGWNNVYIPLRDGSHVIATVDVVNDQFLFRDPYHLSDYIDNGDGDDLKAYYTSWTYSYTGASPNVVSEDEYTMVDIDTKGSTLYYTP